MNDHVRCGREVYNAALTGRLTFDMRRLLVALTLVLLLAISAGIGILVAYWPHWSKTLLAD
jgi:hypothetical protein